MPQDEVSLLRIINTPPRGIGSKSVELLMNAAVSGGQPVDGPARPGLSALGQPARRQRFAKHGRGAPPAAGNRELVGTLGS
jgi:superfamily I DNA/RNA helicase